MFHNWRHTVMTQKLARCSKWPQLWRLSQLNPRDMELGGARSIGGKDAANMSVDGYGSDDHRRDCNHSGDEDGGELKVYSNERVLQESFHIQQRTNTV